MGIRKKPVETNLYYLNSRYYDPEVCRFISMDWIEYINPETLNGLNLYAYCNNNPVMNVDPEGNAWWHWLIGVLILVGLGIATIVTAGIAGVGIGAAFGAGFGIGSAAAIGGSVSSIALSIVSSAFAGALMGGVTSSIASGIMTAIVGGNVLEAMSTSFMFGTILGAVSGGLNKVPFASLNELNIGLHMGVNSVLSLGTYLGQTAYTDGNLDKVSPGGVILSLIGGASSGFLPTKPLLSGVHNYFAIQGAMFFDIVNELRKRYQNN